MNKLNVFISFVITAILVLSSTVSSAPLPLTTIEGNSGVLLTSTAYLANPAEVGEFFGMPSISTAAVFGKHKDLQSFAITENILARRTCVF